MSMEMEIKIMSKEVRKKVLRADGNKEGEGSMEVWKCFWMGLLFFIPCKFRIFMGRKQQQSEGQFKIGNMM